MNNDPIINNNQPNENYEAWSEMAKEVDQGDTQIETQQENTFDELRRSGTLPEGVRDERDYTEYLQEQDARIAERNAAESEARKELFGEIEQLAPNGRKFMTAIIGTLDSSEGYGYDEREYAEAIVPIAMEFAKGSIDSQEMNGIDCGQYAKAHTRFFLLNHPDFKKIEDKNYWLSEKIQETFSDIEIGRRIQDCTDNEGLDPAIEQFREEHPHVFYDRFNKKLEDENCMGLLGENTQRGTERLEADKGITELIAKDIIDSYDRSVRDEEALNNCEQYLGIVGDLYRGKGLGSQMANEFRDLYYDISHEFYRKLRTAKIERIKHVSKRYDSYKSSYEFYEQNMRHGNLILGEEA
ncbi:hypothetical protein IKF34_02695 [Candidatus Saccharibacteria bacterium]|nr:hypothetical protein [Candidatus Saccharibacteria bacterium]